MFSPRRVLVGLLAVCFVPALRADEPVKPYVLPAEIVEAQRLADRIDKHISARWAERDVKPAQPSDNGEFLRRVHLDLTGRIPRQSDLLDLNDLGVHVRVRWINKELLENDKFAEHFATVWSQLVAPADNNVQGQGGGLRDWLKRKFKENASYDQIARELIAGSFEANQPAMIFFAANQNKPEELASTTARLFLGVKIECAQCHNHPFARWKRQQFWEMAAFYSGLKQGREDSEIHEIEIPGTDKKVQARFLDGKVPTWTKESSTREMLADWLLRGDNPFFARAAVNRFWAHFFGIGLVEPVDDLNDQNPASHPELLDELAREFAAHNFDVKYLIRAITFSRTYQLSSAASDPREKADSRLFARMNLKGLTGEQLYDSIRVATDTPEPSRPANRGFMQIDPARAEFLARFSRQVNRTEYHTSILQALTMMNGKLIDDATHLERCNTLRAIAADSFSSKTRLRIEALYLAALSRKPRPDEVKRFTQYVESGGKNKDPKAALSDVFWVLLNSSEFLFNH